MQRPLLIKGEPGTGKSTLAPEVARALGKPLIEWHITSATRAQQLVAWMKRSGIRDRNLRFRVYKAPISNRGTPPMVDAPPLAGAKTMSPADRLELIGAVWGALSPADAPVPGEDKALLDVRLADLENTPQDQSSWSADQSSWAGWAPCALPGAYISEALGRPSGSKAGRALAAKAERAGATA